MDVKTIKKVDRRKKKTIWYIKQAKVPRYIFQMS